MKQWRTPQTFRSFFYPLLAVLLLGLAAVSALQIVPLVRGPVEQWPFGPRMLGYALGTLLLALGAGLAVWVAVRERTLAYSVDRNAVVVLQRGWRYLIPLDRVVAVETGAPAPADKPVRRFGRGGALERVLVETNAVRYLLAVRDREQFVQELESRRRLGVVQPQREGLYRTARFWPQFIGSAAVRRMLVLLVALNLGTWLLLAWRYQLLPETVPVRFDPIGGTAGTRARSYTLLLPSAASAVALLNALVALGIVRRSRLATELLLLGAVLVQLGLLAGTWFIVSGTR